MWEVGRKVWTRD